MPMHTLSIFHRNKSKSKRPFTYRFDFFQLPKFAEVFAAYQPCRFWWTWEQRVTGCFACHERVSIWISFFEGSQHKGVLSTLTRVHNSIMSTVVIDCWTISIWNLKRWMRSCNLCNILKCYEKSEMQLFSMQLSTLQSTKHKFGITECQCDEIS